MHRDTGRVIFAALSRPTSISTEQPIPVIVIAAGNSSTESRGSIDEIKSLLEGLGYSVVRTLEQKKVSRGAAAILGEGKLLELKEAFGEVSESWGVDPYLAFVSEIAPSQQRILERDFDTVVLDRTGIILRVFESRARTRLSRLELELARLIYGMPRIRDDKAVDDREGGGGRGARGNSNVELAKQAQRDRAAELRNEIEIEQNLRRRRVTRREQAQRVALVGYTNAGKSSWMRALTASEVLVEDKLFATLETTVRALQPESKPRIHISDTVGFIRDLPHTLVASFRSTLDEALDTDLLLHVVDASDPQLADRYAVTMQVLDEVGASGIPSRLILNKMDLVDAETRAALAEQYPEALFMSAHSPEDVAKLRQDFIEFFEASMTEYSFTFSFSELGTLSRIRESTRVVHEEYTETGVMVRLLSTQAAMERFGLIVPEIEAKELWED